MPDDVIQSIVPKEDIEKQKEKAKGLEEQAEVVLEEIGEDGIQTQQEYGKVAEIYKDLRTKIKEIEKKRKELTDPIHQTKKKIIKIFKNVKEKPENLKDEIKEEMDTFVEKLEKKKQKKQEQAEKKAKEEAKKEGKDKAEVPDYTKKKTKAKTDKATASTRTRWTYEIQDESKIPKEFMKPDKKKIRNAVKDGKRNLPGVKIYEETKSYVR